MSLGLRIYEMRFYQDDWLHFYYKKKVECTGSASSVLTFIGNLFCIYNNKLYNVDLLIENSSIDSFTAMLLCIVVFFFKLLG